MCQISAFISGFQNNNYHAPIFQFSCLKLTTNHFTVRKLLNTTYLRPWEKHGWMQSNIIECVQLSHDKDENRYMYTQLFRLLSSDTT